MLKNPHYSLPLLTLICNCSFTLSDIHDAAVRELDVLLLKSGESRERIWEADTVALSKASN